MGHRMMGRAHAGLHHRLTDLRRRLADPAGQGTVEYVALILLVAGVLAVVVKAAGSSKDPGITSKITNELMEAINMVDGKKD